eukprot:g21729.t1
MHLKSCGITRSRGDPFAPESERGNSAGQSQSRGALNTGNARSSPAPGVGKKEAAPPRAPPPPSSPPVPAVASSSRAQSPPVPAAASRAQSPPVPAAAAFGPARSGAPANVLQEPSMAFDDEGPVEPMAPCSHCGRSFRQSALARHVGICQKVFQEKRKVFNAVKHAMPDEAVKAKKAHERLEKQEKRQGRCNPDPESIPMSLYEAEALRWLLHMLHKPVPPLGPLGVVSNVKATRAHTKTSIYRLSCNSEFIITEVHPELCRLLRYDPKEMVGMNLWHR